MIAHVQRDVRPLAARTPIMLQKSISALYSLIAYAVTLSCAAGLVAFALDWVQPALALMR